MICLRILCTIIVVVLTVLGIVYHEYGHMHAAKLCHVKVNRFCIGFGKTLWHHVGKDGVDYQIALLPIGGMCEIDEKQQNALSLPKYLCVVLAGVARNMVFGILLLIAGQIVMARGFVEPIILVKNLNMCLQDIFSNVSNIVTSIFNVHYMVETGGTIGQYASVGQQVAELSVNISTQIGAAVICGGYLNIGLVLVNLFPIPGIDGGQAVLRIVIDFCEKILHKTVNREHIVHITNICVVCVLAYSVFLLAIGLPGIRDVLHMMM